jgi:uncharacterized protein (TIGR00290 family)
MGSPLRTVVFWSGGKDSSLVLDALSRDDAYDVVALLTTYEAESEVVPFQSVSMEAVRAQSRAACLDLVEVPLPPQPSNDVYIGRVLAALERRSDLGVTHVAFGDLELADIRAWRESMFDDTDWTPVFPIWGSDTAQLARDFIARGFRATVTTVDTDVLDAGLVGRDFDAAFLSELPSGVDPCGENGEFHTVVWDGPIFDEALTPVLGERSDAAQFASVEVDLRGAN